MTFKKERIAYFRVCAPIHPLQTQQTISDVTGPQSSRNFYRM